MPQAITPIPPSTYTLATINLLSVSMDLPILDISYNRIIQ